MHLHERGCTGPRNDHFESSQAIRAPVAQNLRYDPRAYEPLVEALSNTHEDEKVRGQAAEGLAYLGEGRAVPVLIAALRDPSAEVRFNAAFALGHVGDTVSVPELQRVVNTDTAILPTWGLVSKQAEDAIDWIRARANGHNVDGGV